MNAFLKSILDAINTIIPSYGWSIVAFTILVRLCLLPLDYKSRVGMRKMTKLAPKQQALQKKYEKDPEKLQRKMAELYRTEKASPLSGCWPLLVSMPILIAMYTAMRMMANEQLALQTYNALTGSNPVLDSFLWIKNLWMPDSPFNAAWPNASSLKQIGSSEWLSLGAERLQQLCSAVGLGEYSEALFTGDTLQNTVTVIGTRLEELPGFVAQSKSSGVSINLLITSLTFMKQPNGFYVLPLVCAGSQFLMTMLNPAQPANGTQDQQQQKAGGGFMKWFFPLFSLWLCSTNNAGFALYWVTGNLIAMAQNFFINKYLDRKEKLAAENPVEADETGRGLR